MNAVPEKKAKEALARLKAQMENGCGGGEILEGVKEYAGLKFGLDKIPKDTDLQGLAMLSLKRKLVVGGKITEEELRRQLQKKDCHQISLAVQMKNLLILSVENGLGICLEDDVVLAVSTLEELARAVETAWKGAENESGKNQGGFPDAAGGAVLSG